MKRIGGSEEWQCLYIATAVRNRDLRRSHFAENAVYLHALLAKSFLYVKPKKMQLIFRKLD